MWRRARRWATGPASDEQINEATLSALRAEIYAYNLAEGALDRPRCFLVSAADPR